MTIHKNINITNKCSAQYPIVYKAKESNKDYILCITESLNYTSETK